MVDRAFAERLRATLDRDPNLTESGLAVKAGLSNSVVRKILAGHTSNPRVDTARKICAALGTTLEEFMSDAETEEEKEILRLIMKLPADLRRQLLGYGQALLSSVDQSQQKVGEEIE